jgi:putative heme-binding domain-containing protein
VQAEAPGRTVLDAELSATARIAAAGLRDADPVVRRRSAEALGRRAPASPNTGIPNGESRLRAIAPVADVLRLLNDRDRFVRWSGRILLEHLPRDTWMDGVLAETNPLGAIEGMLAWVRTAGADSLQPVIDKQFALLKQTGLSVENKLRLYRLFMYTTTAIPGGLSAATRRQLHDVIAHQFPTPDPRLNRELALMLAYAGQTQGISRILAAMPAGHENQALQLHYLYALRVVKQGWTLDQKTQVADVLGRSSRWRGGSRFAIFLGQVYDQLAELYTTDADRQVLHARAPDFAPLSLAELAALTAARSGAAAGPSAIVARTQGRVLNKGEIFDEVIYTPRTDRPSPEAGRVTFEASCATCHRVGAIGNDHGVAALNLTALGPRIERRALLESIMFPGRRIAAGQDTTIIVARDGTAVRGLVVREDATGVTVLTADGTTTAVAKPVRSRRREPTTIMADALTDAMNQAQLSGLMAFLQAR